MNIFFYIIVILFGLSVGSFLNVVILRFDELKSILTTRSHCPSCKKELSWYELVPFFSYIILAGRCLACKKGISFQYPLVEVFTALIFVLIYMYSGISFASLILAVIFSLLIVISVYDIIHSEIPDILSYLVVILGLIWTVYYLSLTNSLSSFSAFLPYIYAIAIGGGFFGFLVLISRQKWMGAGDIILGVFMGIFLGLQGIIIALFLSFILGAIFSLILISFKKKTLKDALPFGPFLALATIITFFFGEQLLIYYWNILM